MFTHFSQFLKGRARRFNFFLLQDGVFLVPFGQLCLPQSNVAWAEFCFSHCSRLSCVAGVSAGKGTTAMQAIFVWLSSVAVESCVTLWGSIIPPFSV